MNVAELVFLYDAYNYKITWKSTWKYNPGSVPDRDTAWKFHTTCLGFQLPFVLFSRKEIEYRAFANCERPYCNIMDMEMDNNG